MYDYITNITISYKDTELADLIKNLENKALPNCEVRRQKVLTSAYHGYYVVDGMLRIF